MENSRGMSLCYLLKRDFEHLEPEKNSSFRKYYTIWYLLYNETKQEWLLQDEYYKAYKTSPSASSKCRCLGDHEARDEIVARKVFVPKTHVMMMEKPTALFSVAMLQPMLVPERAFPRHDVISPPPLAPASQVTFSETTYNPLDTKRSRYVDPFAEQHQCE
jgi:hypothetical protein